MQFISENATTVCWIALLIIFAVAEAVTVQLVSVWFAVGALAGLIANLCGANVTLQIVIFLFVSIGCFIATRPLVKKFTANRIEKTNADRCIGDTAVVVEEINNVEASGQVKVNGNIWTARSMDNSVIPVNARVTVEKIEGVKLIVSIEKE